MISTAYYRSDASLPRRIAWAARQSPVGMAASPWIADMLYRLVRAAPRLITTGTVMRMADKLQRWAVLDPREGPIRVCYGPLKDSLIMNDPSRQFPTFRVLTLEEVMLQVLFQKLLRPGSVIYDVGANVGIHTILFSRLCGTSGRVYAFEPWPENCSALSANLKINSITNVEVVPAAVSERSGSQTFHRGSDDSQGSLLPRAEDPFPGECIQVPTLSLDEFVELPQARPPELLKLDIEGGEAGALRGARRVLVDHKPVVLCEIHGQTFGEEVRSILSETSFRLFILEAGFRALTPREILPPWCHILACAEQSFSEIAAAMGNQ